MVRRSRSMSFLVPVWASAVSPIRILPENSNRELYSIQNLDGANSVWVSPSHHVTAAVGDYVGQEVVARGYVSDDMDQGEVWCTCAAAAGCRIVVQETISEVISKPGRAELEGEEMARFRSRYPARRESRVM